MKKILSILLVAALATPMFAEKLSPEEVASADYSEWLPAQGDFSIGFSVDPFANFLGQMFSNFGATPGNYRAINNGAVYNIGGQALFTAPMVSIMGSYMLTDNLAIKANIGVIVNYERKLFNVQDDAARFADQFSRALVQDEAKLGQYGGSFAAGIEYRLGKKRVQGVFGAGIMYAFQTSSTKLSYGNAITAMNQIPSVAAIEDLNGAALAPWATAAELTAMDLDGIYSGLRLINDHASAAGQDAFWHRVGLYTSIGVEWFVAPKIALGLNVNLDLLYKWSNNVCKQYEGFNLQTNQVDHIVTDVTSIKNYSGVTFGTENIGANLYLNFFF